jgi:hypothetical protein
MVNVSFAAALRLLINTESKGLEHHTCTHERVFLRARVKLVAPIRMDVTEITSHVTMHMVSATEAENIHQGDAAED